MQREVAWREGLLAGLAGVVLAVLMSWPLALHLGSEIGKDLGDPLLQAWQVAWIGHALVTSPLDLWQANTFWPYDDTLAFSDALIGYAPVGLLAQASPHAALVGYNALFLFAYALAFVGAYLLARELGTGWIGAAAAGAAFAYAPWKLTQNGHLHVLSSGGIPLALFLLVRGYRRRSRWTVLAGWLVAAWQMSLGFTLGLQLVLPPGRARARARPRSLEALAAGSRPRCARGDGGRRRDLARRDGPHGTPVPARARRPSGGPPDARVRRDVLAAAEELPGRARGELAPRRRDVARTRAACPRRPRCRCFRGSRSVFSRSSALWARCFRGGCESASSSGTATCAVLSLGVRDVDGLGRYATPYRFLFDFVPGWDGVRTPGRINTLTSLGLALLAGAGLCVIVRGLRGRTPAVAVAAGALGIGLVLVEGLGPLTHPRVTPPPPPSASSPHHSSISRRTTRSTCYWSTAGFPEIVNGFGGFDPAGYDRLRKEVAGFPDARSVDALRELGVRTVLFHPEFAPGTAWEKALEKPTAGLGLERRQVGDVTVFRVRPS